MPAIDDTITSVHKTTPHRPRWSAAHVAAIRSPLIDAPANAATASTGSASAAAPTVA
jgi:hypothetical protein